MTDNQLREHLHARGYRIEITDVPMIREGAEALAAGSISDEQIGEIWWKEYRALTIRSTEQALEFARAVLALQPEPTVEQAIASLKIALRDSKGWTIDYSDAIIRDAIDRVPEAAMGVEPGSPAWIKAQLAEMPEPYPTTDCDQAFEEHYKTSSRDPSNAGDLAIWRAGWGAKGGNHE